MPRNTTKRRGKGSWRPRRASWGGHGIAAVASRLSDAAAFQGLLIGTLQLARVTPDRAESDAILEARGRAALRLAT